MTETSTNISTNLTRAHIENQAEALLRLHGLVSVPIDPVTLANRAGIKVHNAKFANDNISGMISKKNDNVTLLVNHADPPQRKRFTIAHELGHHFLHLLEDGDFVDRDLFRPVEPMGEELTAEKKQEIQANAFAAALLMPRKLVHQYYSEVDDLSELASIFNVSETAMAIRLNQLGLGYE